MVTLVLLPGMDGTGELFVPFVEALPTNVEAQVVRYPAACTRYEDLEKFVREQLPQGKPFLLLGESFSGPIAIAIAASPPKELVGLVLCATFARCPVPRLAGMGVAVSALPINLVPSWAISFLLLGRFSTARLRSALSVALAQVPASTLRERLCEVLSIDVSARLAKVAVPVVYMRASCDRVIPQAASRHIERVLPSVKVVSIEAPHFLLQVNPGAGASVVCALVQEVASSSNPSIERTAVGKPPAAAHVER